MVEINESKFRKWKFNKGHHADVVWIMGALERNRDKKCLRTSVKLDMTLYNEFCVENI